jgi:hypothetical protein
MAYITMTIGTASNTVGQLKQVQADSTLPKQELNLLIDYLGRCSGGNEVVQALYVTLNADDPVVQPDYNFTVTSANATVGAIYTNNGNAYTIGGTIAAGTFLITTGNGAPLTSGTLTKIYGTGDSTITFSAVSAFPQNKIVYTSSL